MPLGWIPSLAAAVLERFDETLMGDREKWEPWRKAVFGKLNGTVNFRTSAEDAGKLLDEVASGFGAVPPTLPSPTTTKGAQ